MPADRSLVIPFSGASHDIEGRKDAIVCAANTSLAEAR